MEVLRNEYREGFLGIEIGIGSGVISVELLAEFPKLTMIASEFSQIAQSCARENAARILGGDAKIEHRLKLLTPKNSLEVFEPFSSSLAQERSDFLITNPPYLVATSDEEVDLEVKDHEPHLALFSPPQDSVYFYRKLAEGAVHFLKPSGYLFAELPHERSNVIVDLFNEYNWETEIRLDLTGRERVLIARLRS
jgi:release factor glutamine methyltransferase